MVCSTRDQQSESAVFYCTRYPSLIFPHSRRPPRREGERSCDYESFMYAHRSRPNWGALLVWQGYLHYWGALHRDVYEQ